MNTATISVFQIENVQNIKKKERWPLKESVKYFKLFIFTLMYRHSHAV